MITREELEKRYATLSNNELLDIIEDKYSYTELAVLVALEEVSRRKLNENDIKKYKENAFKNVQAFIKKNIEDDLTFLQKNLFFFLWIPFLNFLFKRSFMDDGFVLKLKQANYYSWSGFILFVVAGIIQSQFKLSNSTFWILWILSFLIAYNYDEFFNRKRQIKKLNNIFGNGNTE
jgi:hypothetical protein